MIFSHGDVVLVKVDSIPEGFKKVKNVKNGFVIEHGEGIHKHLLATLDMSALADKLEVYENDKGEMYIKVKSPIQIDHEEHGRQIIEEGIFKKGIERSYDYEANEERKIID